MKEDRLVRWCIVRVGFGFQVITMLRVFGIVAIGDADKTVS